MWNILGPALTTLAGFYIAADANRRAADLAASSALRGAEITANAIREGNQQAQQTLNQIRAEGAPAGTYLRRIVAEPQELTPEQQVALEDLRRSMANQIRGSSIAGSGRTAAALFRRGETDFINQALAQNKARADNAARTMYGAGTNAATAVANSQQRTGELIGNALGPATAKAGLYETMGELATGQLAGRALGDIGSLIANQQRESRYADR